MKCYKIYDQKETKEAIRLVCELKEDKMGSELGFIIRLILSVGAFFVSVFAIGWYGFFLGAGLLYTIWDF
jgi:hypothetical protein